MKRILAFSIGCLALSFISTFALINFNVLSLSKKIAYVNTDKLFNSYQAMLSARRTYQAEKQEWEHNLQTLAEEARLAQETHQHLGAGSSPRERAASDDNARLKQQQFYTYQAAVQKQGPAEMQRLTQPVVDAANRYLTAYSKQQQYDLVLSAGGGADVVYVAEALDITERVAQGLNQALADSLRRTGAQPSRR